MDIWSWFHGVCNDLRAEGQDRLVDLLHRLSSDCCDGNHAAVDAAYPEALALARAQGHPWLEVFVRHWHLQSQVLKRGRGAENLSEAVSLLEFSSRPETRDCPQSVCAVQDLANCYGSVDGPGYADERLAVADETLARIDPGWDCWQCISVERIEALLDAGRVEEERAARKKLRDEVSIAGDVGGELVLGEAQMEIRAGNLEAADKLLQEMPKYWGGGQAFDIRCAIAKAHLHALRGEADKALGSLPSWAEAAKTAANFTDWTRAASAIHAADENTRDLRRHIWEMGEHATRDGRPRDAITIYGIYADLSLDRGALLAAEEALDRIDALMPKLVRDMGAAEAQQARRAALSQAAAAATNPIPDRDTLLELARDEAADLDALRRAHDGEPSDVDVALAFARALERAGFHKRAADTFRDIVTKDPSQTSAWEGLGSALAALGDGAAFDREIANRDRTGLPDEALNGMDWATAQRLKFSDPEAATARLEDLLQREGDSLDVLSNLAYLSFRQGDHVREASLWTRCLALKEDAELHWNRLTAATLAGDWAQVRDDAAALQMDVGDGDGPIELNWGFIRVAVEEEVGRTVNWYAIRTGPATARIDGLSAPGSKQLHGTDLVFDPAPLNRLDQTDEDGRQCDGDGFRTFLYPALRLQEAPNTLVHELDGVHPGSDIWSAACEKLEAVGVIVEQRSSDEYVVKDGEADKEVPGLYAWLGIPPGVDANLVERLLSDALSDSHMIWPGLLNEIGARDKLANQQQLAERYRLPF